MPNLKVNDFVELVKRSGLVESSRLEKVLSELEQEQPLNESGIVCSGLIRAGLLTEWQSEILLEGRFRGFFLGKYKLLDHIGSGGMSTVYLAEHQVMRRRVAIKVLPKHRVNDSSYLARFHQEARAAASLDDPHVVRAFDVDNDGDVHFLVMEYVDGVDVQNLVNRDGPLAYRTAADFTRQAAVGLHHAHEMGLIHRDMKPANLLVDKSNIVKVLDLGLARFADDTESSLTIDHDEKVLGTVDYLAPEQALDSHSVDRRADIYGLGCTLYFMLTGSPPFPEGSMAQRVIKHQNAEPADIRIKRPDIPPGLLAICHRMMAKRVEQRFQTCAEVGNALRDWLDGKAVNLPTLGAAASFVPPAAGSVTPTMHEDDLLLVDMDGKGGSAPPNKPATNNPAQGAGSKAGGTKPAPDIGAAARQIVAKSAGGSGKGPLPAGAKPPSGVGNRPGSSPAVGGVTGATVPGQPGASGPMLKTGPAGSSPMGVPTAPGGGQGSGPKNPLGVANAPGPVVTGVPTSNVDNNPTTGPAATKPGGSGVQGKPAPRPPGLPIAKALPQAPLAGTGSLVDDLFSAELGSPAGGVQSLANLDDLVNAGTPPITLRSGPHSASSKQHSGLPWDSTWFLIFIGLFLATAVLLIGWIVVKFVL